MMAAWVDVFAFGAFAQNSKRYSENKLLEAMETMEAITVEWPFVNSLTCMVIFYSLFYYNMS